MTDMNILFQRVFPPLDENYRLFIVRRNMLPEYSFQLSTVMINSIDHLIRLCKQMDEAKLIDERRRCGPMNSQLLEPNCFAAVNNSRIHAVSEINLNAFSSNRNSQTSQRSHSPNSNTNFRYTDRRTPPLTYSTNRPYSPVRGTPLRDFSRNATPYNNERRTPPPLFAQTEPYYQGYRTPPRDSYRNNSYNYDRRTPPYDRNFTQTTENFNRRT